MIVSQLTRLLSAPPGDLVYHLVVLFALWAVLLLALGQGRRTDWRGTALRVTIAAIGLLVLRGLSVILALAASAGAANPMWLMPPLERFVSVASLGLLAWAFLHWMDDYPQAGLVLVVVNTLGSVILYAVLAQQWYRDSQTVKVFYNATPADWLWTVWAGAIALLATLAALTRRRAQWGLVATFFALFSAGYLMHLVYAEPQTHVAGWVRLVELCAYPLLAGLMLVRSTEQEEPVPAALPAALTAAAPWTVIEACQRVAEATNISVAVQRAGVAIGNLLGTDVLAIGLLNGSSDTIDLVAVCRPGAAPRIGPAFDLASQLPVQLALQRKRGGLLDVDQESRLATLAALVGGANGPLWIQPLVHHNTAVGVLIAGRFTQRKQSGWTAGEAEALNGLCDVLAYALVVANTTGGMNRQVDQLQTLARERESALSQAQTQAQQLAAQVAETEALRKRTPLPVAPSAPRPRPTARPTARAEPQIEEHGLPPAGEKRLRVRVRLDPKTPLKPARAMMVLTHIKRVGRIIACNPVEADLRSGGFEDEFTVTFSTESDPSSVRTALAAIRDVINIEVQIL